KEYYEVGHKISTKIQNRQITTASSSNLLQSNTTACSHVSCGLPCCGILSSRDISLRLLTKEQCANAQRNIPFKRSGRYTYGSNLRTRPGLSCRSRHNLWLVCDRIVSFLMIPGTVTTASYRYGQSPTV